MKLEMKFVKVGKALLPTYASASIFKCSNLTSIDGKSIPTLFFLSLKIKVRKISTKDILCFTRIHRPYKNFFWLLGYYNKLILFVYQFIRRVLTERIVKKEILKKYF